MIVGENIHATRTLSRVGRHITTALDGRAAVRFETFAGERFVAIPAAITEGAEFAAGRVKHIQVALLALLAGSGSDADDARAYIETVAARQAVAGADWIDLNVDEIAQDASVQRQAMALLVQIVEGSGILPPSLDSSSEFVIAAGIDASRAPERLLLNSASLERPRVLDLAVSARCAVVVSAAGRGGLPSGTDERVSNAEAIVGLAAARGIGPALIHVDPLVLPVGVDPDAGAQFFEAVSRLRVAMGPDIHITGGLSNVSFGLPGRRLLNDVFIDLATEAGADAGIIDPVSSSQERVFGRDRSARAYRLAADFLTGADQYGMEYITAFRAGDLAGEV